MKILHIHDEVWDSGLAHYALTLAQAQQESGQEVNFWAAYGSYAARQAKKLGLNLQEMNNPWLSLHSLRSRIKSLGIEVINAHTGSSHSLAAALALGRKIAVVRTRADARPPANNLMAKLLARRTQAMIAANSRLQRQMAEAFPKIPVKLVFQGIPEPAAFPQSFPGSPVVGILGRLDPVKGHDDFMDAAAIVHKQFPKALFLAAGKGSAQQLTHLRWQAGHLGLEGYLKFLDYVPDAVSFIDSCSIGVVASTGSEAVSRAALEWMSRGRPLIATSVGCLPDLIEHGQSGIIIPPQNSTIMAQAMAALIADEAFAVKLGQKARKRFQERYGLDRFILETESFYQNAIDRLSS